MSNEGLRFGTCRTVEIGSQLVLASRISYVGDLGWELYVPMEQGARLWDTLDGFDVGFCLDTCHAHAGGEELLGIVDRVKAITGRIDLVHANDSKDTFDSGRDRHDNFGRGKIDPKLISAVVRAANAPVVVETPGGADGQRADIAMLREHLG